MYIQPNSTIQLMANIPLNDRQTDTFWFGTPGNQELYFAQFVTHTFNAQSYQRVNREWCKLEVNPETIHECNYMRFKNTAFGDKWFYAFILDSDYINNNTAIVHYKIDPMQTWFFEYSLNMKQCFVEREHTETDVIGENLEDEPVVLGDYWVQDYVKQNIMDKEDMSVVVALGWFDPQQQQQQS